MKTNAKITGILRLLIVTSCLLNGLLAGENTYRYMIEVPAWQHLDPGTWAQYSRHADLGNGIFLFPVEAILSTVISCMAAVIIMRSSSFPSVAITMHTTAVLALIGIGLTFLAAPQMLQLRTGNVNPEHAQKIFEKFHYWGKWRALVQILSFITSLIAVTRIYSMNTKN